MDGKRNIKVAINKDIAWKTVRRRWWNNSDYLSRIASENPERRRGLQSRFYWIVCFARRKRIRRSRERERERRETVRGRVRKIAWLHRLDRSLPIFLLKFACFRKASKQEARVARSEDQVVVFVSCIYLLWTKRWRKQILGKSSHQVFFI